MFGFLVGFRKFFFGILVVLLLTGFLISGHIDGKTYGTSVTSITVGFFSTNLGEHIINTAKEWVKGTLTKNKDKLKEIINKIKE